MKITFGIICLLLLSITPASGGQEGDLTVIFPVTCVSPGLAGALVEKFEEENNISIKMISLCTGAAIELAKQPEKANKIDVLIGHDLDAEEKFAAAGYAVNLRPVFYSDYVLVGPPEDPAGIKGMNDAVKAVKKIAKKRINFCSRGDLSGTHSLEMKIWKLAKIKPKGNWYIKTKAGTSATLTIAQRKRAYFISHWATYNQMLETIDLIPVVDDKDTLITTYEVMVMNPERFPDIRYIDAMTFIGFLTSPGTQKFISEFGQDEFGRQIFWPLAVSGVRP
jgi:tungstate transport system substrate-binding protein